jgi:asparagine synthase (glutamine-hydrolysing)
MSAIWAWMGRAGQPAEAATLERMSAALAPWGGRPATWASGPVGLGWRAMDFTPEAAREQQPRVGRQGQCILVMDGRLDNRPELAATLGLPPAEARALTDSEYVARAYERWGRSTPAQLIGSLAFIVWDGGTQTLLAASTPGNKRSLFYFQNEHWLALRRWSATTRSNSASKATTYAPSRA